jgi:hypothetical protein
MNGLSVSSQQVFAFVSKEIGYIDAAFRQKRLYDVIYNQYGGVKSSTIRFNTVRQEPWCENTT